MRRVQSEAMYSYSGNFHCWHDYPLTHGCLVLYIRLYALAHNPPYLKGVGQLFPWNVIINAEDYFGRRFCGTVFERNFENSFSFGYNTAVMVGVLIALRFVPRTAEWQSYSSMKSTRARALKQGAPLVERLRPLLQFDKALKIGQGMDVLVLVVVRGFYAVYPRTADRAFLSNVHIVVHVALHAIKRPRCMCRAMNATSISRSLEKKLLLFFSEFLSKWGGVVVYL